MPHSDMGKTVQNYNRPKVSESPQQAGVPLPLPAVTLVSAVGCLLENPVYLSGTRHVCGSDNPISVWSRQGTTPENQQETASAGSSETIRQPSRTIRDDEMVRALWRHREVSRNDWPAFPRSRALGQVRK
jgi:hypothetical protein